MAADNEAAMAQYLEDELGVENDLMRERIQAAGFSTLRILVKKEPDFAKKVCNVVRKGTGGVAASKDVPVTVEEGMRQLILMTRYLYVTQRELDYDQLHEINRDALQAWMDDNQKNSPDNMDSVAVFNDSLNKKAWFETIIGWLTIKVGPSGLPLVYAVRNGAAALTEVLPDPDEEGDYDADLAANGRHNGHFWRGDNKAVWIYLKLKVEGTTAWSAIKGMTNDGRRAFFTLRDAYLGGSVLRMLMKRAESTLSRIVFDGRSKNWTLSKHLSKMREAFDDMRASGNALTPMMEVEKLTASFQYEPLKHLTTQINVTPLYQDNFEQAAAFITSEMHALKLKNGTDNRGVGSLGVMDIDEDTELGSLDQIKEVGSLDQIKANKKQVKKLKRKVKALKKKAKTYKDKGSKGAHKKNEATKFSKSNPGAFIPYSEWNKLSEEEKKAAREARQAAGIPTRKIASMSISTGSGSDSEDDGDKKPRATKLKVLTGVPQSLLKPTKRPLVTTQRSDLYAIAKQVDKDTRRVGIKPLNTKE